MKRADIEPLIVQEWLQRPENKRSENDVLDFYGYLSKERPILLSFRTSGSKYQVLKIILQHHIVR